MKPVPAFVTPAAFARRSHLKRFTLSRPRVPHYPFFLHHPIPFRIAHPHPHAHSHVVRQPIAVQARPVSGGSDGEVRDQLDPASQKNSSVGVTIVSDCDARLRRIVTERIVAEARVGRVVVVTTAGITATAETDGLAQPPVVNPPDQNPTAPDPALDQPLQDPAPAEQADDPVNGVESSESSDALSPASVVDNLGGWISCSSPEEMVEVVLKLSASKECDYIVAECSADESIEPHELAHILDSRGGSTLRVDALVSVLDGDTVLQDLSALPAPTEMPVPVENADTVDDSAGVGEAAALDDAPVTEQQQPLKDDGPQRAMMVVKLVENANVIVVKQSSAEKPDQLSRVQSVVSVLNGSASIVPATDEIVPVNLLVNTNTYDNETLKLGATWKRVLLASRTAEPGTTKPPNLPKSLKEATFLYKARRPFHPQRLYEQIKAVATFTGVIRSTGRIWLATRMEAPLEWNQAGVAATLRRGKPFWAAVPQAEWTLSEEERQKVMENWDTQHGDRETEIVFVGIDIDKTRLQMLLDGCLLHDEEIVFPNMWANFEDPFVEWVPLPEDEEEEEEVITNAGINQGAEALTSSQDMTEERTFESETAEPVTASNPVPEGENAVSSTNAFNSENVAVESDKKEVVEGEVSTDVLPDEVLESLSALDVLTVGFSEDDGSAPQPQPSDEGYYDEDEAVIASWDGSVADGILTQIPQKGLPVTLVTGFLGSGKTTLLNYILTANHGLRVAVLINEYGEIDIDNQLVEKGTWNDDDVMELLNGCICCSINDSFVSSVSKILERRDEIDYLIVETTGVADPVPVINSLMASDLANDVRVDGILTVVDAENFDTETHMGSEAALSQVMAADTILLSKTDIASKEKVEETISFIRSIRPAARILKSQRGRVPLNLILDVGVRITDSPTHLQAVTSNQEEAEGHDHDHDHDHDHKHEHDHAHDHDDAHDHDHEHGPDCSHESHNHEHPDHLEADGFVTTSFKSDLPLDPELFMDRFLRRLPEGVFRAKGLLSFYGYGKRYVFQLSGRRYQFEEDEWPDEVAPSSQLVIIGRDLNLELLRETLESCQAGSEA